LLLLQRFSIFWILLTLLACGAQEQEKKINYIEASTVAVTKWSLSSFPLTFKSSQSFDPAMLTVIEDMQLEWNNASNRGVTFFNAPAVTTEKNYGNINDYRDNEFGVYRLNQWPSAFPSGALAVTQTYGQIRNYGTVFEFIELFHADILVNEQHYDFSTTFQFGSYDFGTVILHELGHVLGLKHVDAKVDTVMLAGITKWTVINEVYAYDQNYLDRNYFSDFTPSAIRTLASIPYENEPVEAEIDESKVVVIHHYLMSDETEITTISPVLPLPRR
jgi:hypothetical protein